MERFLTQKEISSYDQILLDEFACDKKTLERYLNDIETNYAHIVTIKKSRKKYWKLIGVSDIFEEFISNSYDLTNLFDLAQSFDPEIFKELERGTLSKVAKSNEQVFLFKNSIMEELKSERVQEIFKSLKVAIKNHEYRDITYRYDEVTVHKNMKCIKLMFVGNNWYLMAVDENNELLFRRLSFIEKIGYAQKSTFRKKDVEHYLHFLTKVQNPMTRYGVIPKVATIKATPHVAKYFEKGMKPLLSSQKFLKKCDDGSVLFTLEYTQELEVLPSIQRWLPDLIIVEPEELKEAYREKLLSAVEQHEDTSSL
jgi:predicted DNA-binding transcriptional regulator YafY